MAQMGEEELQKAIRGLWPKLKDQYIKELRYIQTPPQEFANRLGETSEDHWAVLVEKFEYLEKYF